jgi:nickel transport protein
MRKTICLLILVSVSMFISSNAFAHKVSLFAYVEGGKIFTESFFPDGRAVEGGKVTVYDSQDQLLLEGKTDSQGYFNFPVPKIDDLTIVLDATMGHKADFKLKKEEVGAGK